MFQIEEEIKELITTSPSLEERKQIIEELNERCYQQTGSNLSPRLLNLLGDWLLSDTLKDMNPYKVHTEEYPILSSHQLLRRKKKTVLMGDEASLSMLDYHRKNNSLKYKATPKEEV